MGPWFTAFITVAILYPTYVLWHLYQNYRTARSTGLPIIICPFDPDGVSNYSSWSSPRSSTEVYLTHCQTFHALFSVALRPVFQCLLPVSIFATVELSIWGWEFRDKAAIHEKLGPAFIFVTTGLNRLICADPAMANHIMARRRDYVHPETTTQAMGFLGANIVTVSEESKGDSPHQLLADIEQGQRRSLVTPTPHRRPSIKRTHHVRSVAGER